MACNCIEEVDTKLAEYNIRILVPMFIIPRGGGKPEPRVFVETVKIDTKKRAKTPAVFATFCPFCGLKYEETP